MADSTAAQTGSQSAATAATPAAAPAAAPTATTTAAPAAPASAAPITPAVDVENPEALEAEDDATVSDGASIDERLSSFTASLASSAIDYPVEHGRRYHAFRPGSYFMPNDEVEMDRLDLAHALALHLLGGKLYAAPLEKEKVHTILDIGTGTGIWAMEMGDLFPNANVFGNDLSAIQPEWVPPNVKFEIDDVESPWIDDRKYDYVYCRYMHGSIADWPKLVKNVYNSLNPGGWAEFMEVTGMFYSTDGTLTEDHSTKKWVTMLYDAIESTGRESKPGPKLKGWVQDAGFQSIGHQKHLIPIGPWAKDQYYKDVGMMNLAQILAGLEGFTMRMFCGVLGWTQTEAEVLLAEVRKELKTPHKFHAQYDMHVVYGQKPLEESE